MTSDFILTVLAFSVVAATLLVWCSYSTLGLMQQHGYREGKFIKWAYKGNNPLFKRAYLLALSLFLLVALVNLCFSFLGAKWANLVSCLPFVGMCLVYLYASKKFALKVPVNPTYRLRRLAVCFFILLVGVIFGLSLGMAAIGFAVQNELFDLLRFLPVTLLPLALPLVLALASAVMKIYEIPHNKKYVAQAKKILDESTCKKVGITGSYGKTSVKSLAAQMLASKYRVLATPHSYNTPLGIAKTVLEQGLDCDVFLAEMGARKRGDIAELCDLVNPSVGIVTGVTAQHLETFKTLSAVAEEKGVLVQRTQTSIVGMGAASLAGEGTVSEGKQFAAEDVVCTAEGTAFTLRLPDGSVRVRVSLLGKHAAEDIALAAMLCSVLGMSKEEIAAACENLQPIPHRLQLLQSGGKNILDDSYNSNIEGAKNAVEVLKLFGGSKFVVTPGLVELGEIEERENANLGASFVGLDRVILVGETLVLPVRAGYLAAGGEEEKITVVPTLNKASELLERELGEGDSVLFLNDLPDCY